MKKKKSMFKFIIEDIINMDILFYIGRYILFLVLCLVAIERMIEIYTTGNLHILTQGGIGAKIFITAFMFAIMSIPVYLSSVLLGEIFQDDKEKKKKLKEIKQ